MSKDKFKKIPISEFISEKKLSKIMSIIEKSDDVETNYDRIEMLLDDDYNVKDLGTNRLVLLHKKSKYKNLIFKVAGDSHGIEANYREFYNGDLDKRLTFSYSISKDGTFIVQERVKPMTRDLMKKHKKDVREMLLKLSKKILLVDCKIENFKNFGIRDNGNVCLLDHGDTVPLPNYQSNDIVNINEESFVSLRCKKPAEMGVSKKHLKPCNGKLKYSKNFDYLICEECGGVCTVNDAYREFYGDKSIKIKDRSKLDLEDSFDPDEWKAHIQKYCIETMSHANNNNINNEGENTMKTKIIENRNCVQVKGFWLPEPVNEFAGYAMMYTAVKMGTSKPQRYLEKLGLNIEDYKVYPSEHTPSEKPKKKIKNERLIDEYGFDLLTVRDKIIEKIVEIGKYQTVISYIECAQLAPDVDFSDIRNIKGIRGAIASDKKTTGCIYNEEGFSIRLNDRYVTDNSDNESINDGEDVVEETTSLNEVETHSVTYVNNTDDDDEPTEIIEEVIEESDEYDDYDIPETEPVVDFIDSNELAKEYAKQSNSIIVEDEEEYEETKSKLIFSYDELEDNAIDFNGVKCVVINKYAIPVDIIYRYSNDDGYYELPSSKMKALLKANGLYPKKYKITNPEPVEEEDIVKENIAELQDTQITSDVASIFSPGEYDADSKIFINELYNIAREYAKNNPDKVDSKFGLVEIPAEIILYKTAKDHAINGEVLDHIENYYSVDENGNSYFTYENLNSLYEMICKANGSSTNISCDYITKTIGVELEEFITHIPEDEIPQTDVDNEEYDYDEDEDEIIDEYIEESITEDNHINSYTSDNNTNNNEEIADNSEKLDDSEEDEILTRQVLDAILELTRAVNANSEIMSKQNELMTLKLNSLDEKLSNITEIVTPKFIPESIEEGIGDEMNISNKVHNSNDDIVMLSEEDLEKKIIAVNVNNTTVCFDILDLAKKAIGNTDAAEYLSVTDVTVSNL